MTRSVIDMTLTFPFLRPCAPSGLPLQPCRVHGDGAQATAGVGRRSMFQSYYIILAAILACHVCGLSSQTTSSITSFRHPRIASLIVCVGARVYDQLMILLSLSFDSILENVEVARPGPKSRVARETINNGPGGSTKDGHRIILNLAIAYIKETRRNTFRATS